MTLLGYFRQFDKDGNIILSEEYTSDEGVFIDLDLLNISSFENDSLRPLEDLLWLDIKDELYHSGWIQYIDGRLFEFLNKTTIIVDTEVSNYNTNTRRPYFRLRGKRITEDQAFDIIRKTDSFLQYYVDEAATIPIVHFPNWWLSRNHIPTHYGWCHPNGIVGLNGITATYPTIHELLSDILKLKFSYSYLDLIIALTNYDEICESEENWYNRIELGIWIHSDTIEFMNQQRTIEVYKQYELKYSEKNTEIYNPTYYEKKQQFLADQSYLERCLESHGLNPQNTLSKIKPYIWSSNNKFV